MTKLYAFASNHQADLLPRNNLLPQTRVLGLVLLFILSSLYFSSINTLTFTPLNFHPQGYLRWLNIPVGGELFTFHFSLPFSKSMITVVSSETRMNRSCSTPHGCYEWGASELLKRETNNNTKRKIENVKGGKNEK